jgi:hypothetical protein
MTLRGWVLFGSVTASMILTTLASKAVWGPEGVTWAALTWSLLNVPLSHRLITLNSRWQKQEAAARGGVQ